MEREELSDIKNSLVFIDPPYYTHGRSLYNSFATDKIHSLVAEQLVSDTNLKWLLTYDAAPYIDGLYPEDKVNRFQYQINYSANKRGEFTEFMFASRNFKVCSYDNVELTAIKYEKSPSTI